MVVTGDDVNFRLERAGPIEPANQYRVTFTASPSCTLPASVMTRQYTAMIDERDGRVLVKVAGALFAVRGEAGSESTRDGDRVRFTITDDYGADCQFIEHRLELRRQTAQGHRASPLAPGCTCIL